MQRLLLLTHRTITTDCFPHSLRTRRRFSSNIRRIASARDPDDLLIRQSSAAAAAVYDDDDDDEEKYNEQEHHLHASLTQFLHPISPDKASFSSHPESSSSRFRSHDSTALFSSELPLSTTNKEEYWDGMPDPRSNQVDGEYKNPWEEPPPQTKQQQKQPSFAQLLLNFDPQNPPDLERYATRREGLEAFQLWLECESQQEAVSRYQKLIEDARNRHDYKAMGVVQQNISWWFTNVQDAIAQRQRHFLDREPGTPSAKSEQKFGPYLCTVPADKLAVIVAHETIMEIAMTGGRSESAKKAKVYAGVPFVKIAARIGQAVENEVVVHKMLHERFLQSRKQNGNGLEQTLVSDFFTDRMGEELEQDTSNPLKWTYATSHLKSYLDDKYSVKTSSPRAKTARALRRANAILKDVGDWPKREKIQLGAALFEVLLEHATVRLGDNSEKALSVEKVWLSPKQQMSFVIMNSRLFNIVTKDKLESLTATTDRYRPMVVPPTPWTSLSSGGYRLLKTELMRSHGCQTQMETLRRTDSSIIFDGLNALGSVEWKINKKVLEAAELCWENQLALGTDIPSQTDFEVPEKPEMVPRDDPKPEVGSPEYEANRAKFIEYNEQLSKHHRIKQKNMDLHSLRCTTRLKLDQAGQFADFEAIYFPYNLDFRGRAYPVPPHFSNVNSDLCRGLLMFTEEKPLGERGMFWLKVHLGNLAGNDKISFEKRAEFVDDNMEKVRGSARDPMKERWWMELDDPFQGLATCIEIDRALESGDPASYMCSLPVHMDGSCNGLQHYAALGRDVVGGRAVNLCDEKEPQDVYIGVMHEVIRRVAEDAKEELNFDTSDYDLLSPEQKSLFNVKRSALLVNGLVDRGVVKRTVMTSVYGVTFVGAREQIREKIAPKLEANGVDVFEKRFEIRTACGYLAKVTMQVIGDLFTGAKETMNWLTICARLIAENGHPVAWVSPIGVPAVQPYRRTTAGTCVTLVQSVNVSNTSDNMPIHRSRQVSAFPPNFIHSLDSSHMLLTALEMKRRGLTFSAVHDSFWTHPCDIDEMNVALREVFVDLYKQPLLEDLKATWELRYPDIEFPDVPERGDLNLEEVKRAAYFFQ